MSLPVDRDEKTTSSLFLRQYKDWPSPRLNCHLGSKRCSSGMETQKVHHTPSLIFRQLRPLTLLTRSLTGNICVLAFLGKQSWDRQIARLPYHLPISSNFPLQLRLSRSQVPKNDDENKWKMTKRLQFPFKRPPTRLPTLGRI